MQPWIFSKGKTNAKKFYLRILQIVVQRWIDEVPEESIYAIQLGYLSTHNMRLAQAWLFKQEFNKPRAVGKASA